MSLGFTRNSDSGHRRTSSSIHGRGCLPEVGLTDNRTVILVSPISDLFFFGLLTHDDCINEMMGICLILNVLVSSKSE